LQSAHGNIDQLIGLIQRKTGEARNSIEKFLDESASGGASAFSQAAETAKEYAQQAVEGIQGRSKQATEQFRKTYDQAAEQFKHGYEEAEHLIKDRPAESAAVCFGVGMLVGVILGLSLRSR
jgi:ElaB/YqjD/DUF883 family membrane-anchored ribosome-binding protein